MDIYNDLMRVFGRRMACMVISAVQLQGEHAGQQVTRFYPGFIISVRDQWLFVTAGHSIRQIDDALAMARSTSWCRAFSTVSLPDAPHQDSVAANFPFDYEGSQRAGIYFDTEEEAESLDGRDFGFVKLTEGCMRLLSANGIRPLDESLWLPPQGTRLVEHILVGIPDQLVDSHDVGIHTQFIPENVCILLKHATTSLKGVDRARHKRLVRELPDNLPIDSVVGMSGGPIFAIGDGPEGRGAHLGRGHTK